MPPSRFESYEHFETSESVWTADRSNAGNAISIPAWAGMLLVRVFSSVVSVSGVKTTFLYEMRSKVKSGYGGERKTKHQQGKKKATEEKLEEQEMEKTRKKKTHVSITSDCRHAEFINRCTQEFREHNPLLTNSGTPPSPSHCQ
jgi:hypothetical protein